MNRKRILHAAGAILLLALVVPFAVYAVPGVMGADHSYVILSGSMEPEMSPGDAVIVDDRGAGSIEEDDVITFMRDGSDTPVTHRVVDVREENGERTFETKGDANDNADREPVTASNVVGTVTMTIPLIGYVVHFVNTPLGFVTMVLLPLGLLVLSEAWAFVRDATGDGVDETGSNGNDPIGTTGSVADGGSVVDSDGATTTTGTSAPDEGESTAEIRPEETAESTAGDITIAPTDVAATTVLLVIATPYAAYVALQLQTLTTIAIAYTVGFSAFALGALQVATVVTSRQAEDESWMSSTGRPDHVDPDERADTGTAASDVVDESLPPQTAGDPETNGNDPIGREDGKTVPRAPEFEWTDQPDAARTEDGDS